MYILEISSLNYSEAFDENFNVSKITSLSFCCKYRAIKMQNKAGLLIQHCRKDVPGLKKKKKIQKLGQVLTICVFKWQF